MPPKSLDRAGHPARGKVVSAHRTPSACSAMGERPKDGAWKCSIAGAGGAAHLPGMLAAISILPVLGVPVESKVAARRRLAPLDRTDAGGVPVGTLAIGTSGAANAAISGGGDPGAEISGDSRGAGSVSARLRPTPWENRRV